MNELRIFENEEFGKLKDYKPDYEGEGFVYAVEYGTFVKIGCSINPYNRLQTFIRDAEKYNNTKIGRIAITPSHSNYRLNEQILHRHYVAKRKKETELFAITLDDFCKDTVPILVYEHNPQYKDENVQVLKHLIMDLWKCPWEEDFINIIKAYPYILNNSDKNSVENELRDVADMNCDLENLIFEFGLKSLSPIIMNCIGQRNLQKGNIDGTNDNG